MSALSIAPNHAFDTGASNIEPGADRLARAPAAAASHRIDGFAMQGQSSLIEHVGLGVRRGRLMTGRSVSGELVFWLDGPDKQRVLRGAGGQPVTNLLDARTGARKALAAVRARPSPATGPAAPETSGRGAVRGLKMVTSTSSGAEFKAPADRTSPHLAVDLESPNLNVKGGQGEARFGLLATRFGNKGSALTCVDAVTRASAMGIEVQVTNENPKGSPENARLHAWVQLTNDRTGGGQFANFTLNLSPGEPDANATTYKLPANASAAFVEGYNQASRQIAVALGAQVVRSVAEGRASTSAARPNVSMPVRATRTVPFGRPVRAAQPPSARARAVAATASVAARPATAKQRLARQLSALGIRCDDPTTIRTGLNSHAVVGVTKGGVSFQVAIRDDGSLEPHSAAMAGGRTIRTEPPDEAGHGGGHHAGGALTKKKPLLLAAPKNPFQSVVSVAPPSPESIPRIAQPTKVIGAGEVNVIYEHPTNPRLVVSMTNAKLIAQIAKYSVNGATGRWELASTNADVNTLKWLGQAGLPVIKPIGIVRVGDRYGMVKPKITGAIFSKDAAPASTHAWRQLIKSHGREIIQQLHQIDRSFRSLGVTDTDYQFYITERGMVTLYDPGLVTPEPDPSHYQRRVSALWIDRIKTDLQRIRHDQPVIGPVTGAEQKDLIRS